MHQQKNQNLYKYTLLIFFANIQNKNASINLVNNIKSHFATLYQLYLDIAFFPLF